MESESETYQRYLASREWAVRRQAVLKRSCGICERCELHAVHAVHHLTYARKYHEELSDLEGLCDGCHKFTHALSDYDPAILGEETGRFILRLSKILKNAHLPNVPDRLLAVKEAIAKAGAA